MYSGAWGQPSQVEIPPEPKLTLRRTNLSLFGFALGPINRYIDDVRKRRAEQQTVLLKQAWDQRFQAIKSKNQEVVLKFERAVQATPEFRAYLEQDRRWLQLMHDQDANYQAACERWDSERQKFESARNAEETLLGRLRNAWEAGRPEAIEPGIRISLANSRRWWNTKLTEQVRYDPDTKTLLIECEFPDVKKN
jgi:hypothetical protein